MALYNPNLNGLAEKAVWTGKSALKKIKKWTFTETV